MNFYDAIAKYFDLAQGRSVDYAAETRFFDTIFRRHNVRTVLDLACGTGSHLMELTRLGYQCLGQDASQGMLEVARKKSRGNGLDIEFVQADLTSCRPSRQFDAVLALYALSSLETEAEFAAALASARRALKTGGVFIFNVLRKDSWPSRSGRSWPSPLLLSAVADKDEVRLLRFCDLVQEDDLCILTDIYLITDGGQTRLEVHANRLRLRRLETIKGLLVEQGFEVEGISSLKGNGRKPTDVHICALAKEK